MTTLIASVLGINGLIAKGGGAVAGVDKTLQIWGLSHLVGKTVSAFVDGDDTGDFTVAADGSITISIASIDHDVTAASLIASSADWGESTTPCLVANGGGSIWTNVGIVVGQPFVSQGQRLRPATAADVGSQTGPALGMPRRTQEIAVLVQDAVAVKFGTALTPSPSGDMAQAVFKQADDMTEIAAGTMFSGVYLTTLGDDYTYNSQLCWQIDRPWPCSILAVTQFLKAEERT